MSLVSFGLAVVMGVGAATGAPAQSSIGYTVFAARASVDRQPPPKVTLELADVPIPKAVHQVASQAGLALSWSETNVPLKGKVSAKLHEMPVDEALRIVLRGTGAEAKLSSDGQTIMIVRAAAERRVSSGTVVGTVTDSATRVGLKGAQVRVDGTKLTAVTSDSGNFALRNVPPGDQVLQVRLFGYRPVTRTVTVIEGERTTVRIAMAVVPTVLSGVVTTATGVQRKVEIGNDITTINVDSVMKVAPVTSVTDILETRVPGLTVLHTSGVPGAPSRLRLRGVSSITGNNDPIVVVDGVRVYASQSDSRNDNLARSAYANASPNGHILNTNGQTVGLPTTYSAPSPVDQIDPYSIESIDVFKGPSASAMYGSDAANGVIVITTKHGRAGPTHWNLDLGTNVNWLPGNWPTNYYRFGALPLQFVHQVQYCLWYDPYCVTDSVVANQALNDPRFNMFSHGQGQSASLTVSGGVSMLMYSLTGSVDNTLGNLKLDQWDRRQYEETYGSVPDWMVRPDRYQRYGLKGSLTVQPTPSVRVMLQSSLFNSKQQRGSLENAVQQLEGLYVNAVGDTLVRPGLLFPCQPNGHGQCISLPLVQRAVERATAGAMTGDFFSTLDWQAASWLPLTLTGGLSTVQRDNRTYIPYGISATGARLAFLGDTNGYYGLGRGESEDKTLTVGTVIPSRWLTTSVGANLTNEATNDFSIYTNYLGLGVTTPTQFVLANGGGPAPSTQSTTQWSTYGWYVEPRLNVNSRFFAAPGFRLDGGSASGSNAGLTGYPKIDFSYVAIDQTNPRGPLSLLRPRLAVGVAGTQPAPDRKLRVFNLGGDTTVALNSTQTLPEVLVSTLGNTRLEPETSRELEGGVDVELWRRLTLTATGYNKVRHNAILAIKTAPSALGLNQYVNVGEIRNTGGEFLVDAQVLESRALGWHVGANLSHDENLVVRLNPGFNPDKSRGIVAGYPLFGVWTLPIVAYNDVNHDGVIGPDEVQVADSAVFVGQTNPKYQLNFNTDLQLLSGRLSVHATFAYQNGMTQNSGGALDLSALANRPGLSLGTQAAIMAAYCAVNPFVGTVTGVGLPCSGRSSVGLLQTVNTLRFNDLSINYTLPGTVTQLLHVPHASLVLQGSNLGLHTNYRGFDPNVNVFSTVPGGTAGAQTGDQTADTGQLPQPRIWWLKLNLGN